MCGVGSLALQNACLTVLTAVWRMTEMLQFGVPSGLYHLLINPLCVKVLVPLKQN